MALAMVSQAVLRLTAAMTPVGMPIRMAMAKAMTASWAVTGSFCPMSWATGWRGRQE